MAEKFIQLHFATDAFSDHFEDGRFSLTFPSPQGGCTAVLDRATLERLRHRIAFSLSQTDEPTEK